MKRTALIEKVRKLKLMSEKAVNEHERDNAERLMLSLCYKYDIDIDSINNTEPVSDKYFKYQNKYEKQLFIQIIYKVTGRDSIKVAKKFRTIFKEMTFAQEIEINRLFKIYKRAWQDFIEVQFDAFIQKNEIFGESESDDVELTEEEKERIRKMLRAARNMDKTTIHKEIGYA